MIVLDASAMLEWLLRTPAGFAIDAALQATPGSIHAPHLIDVEVAQGLRRCVRFSVIDEKRAADAIEHLISFPLQRHAHDLFLRRVWQLRGNITAYDALYIALAESLAATLLTRDRKLAAGCGGRVQVTVI